MEWLSKRCDTGQRIWKREPHLPFWLEKVCVLCSFKGWSVGDSGERGHRRDIRKPVYYSHRSPREAITTCHARSRGSAMFSSRDRRQEWGERLKRSFMGVSTDRQGKQGKVNGLEVATLNNSSGFWAMAVVSSSCSLPLKSQAEQYCFSGCRGQKEEVTLWTGEFACQSHVQTESFASLRIG